MAVKLTFRESPSRASFFSVIAQGISPKDPEALFATNRVDWRHSEEAFTKLDRPVPCNAVLVLLKPQHALASSTLVNEAVKISAELS